LARFTAAPIDPGSAFLAALYLTFPRLQRLTPPNSRKVILFDPPTGP
jgi:hypothetical protein